MWLAKWILSSIVLHINAFEYVKDEFALRINGLQGLSSYQKLYGNVINRNLMGIPLIDFISTNFEHWEIKSVLIIFIALVLMFINLKELKNKKYLIIFVLIAITPYIRYLVLANHSYRHAMFTFRDQIITIIVILYIIIDCFNYKLLTKKINVNKLFQNKQMKEN